jgi:hypothetical protein
LPWFGQKRHDALEGKWAIDPADVEALAEYGNVEMEFVGGKLRYEIVLADKRQVILMTYRVDGDEIVTTQPSHPKAERTTFHLDGDTLTLAFGGRRGRFLRQS